MKIMNYNTRVTTFFLLSLAYIASLIFPFQAYSGNHIIPATLCKASDPSTSVELKSRESGLENLSQVKTIEIICPLPIQIYSEQSKTSDALMDLKIFVHKDESDSKATECELTHQVGFSTESRLLPTNTNTNQVPTELLWKDISYEKQSLSGYVISCAMHPQSVISAIQITNNSSENDEPIVGSYCAGAMNPIEFGEDITSLRYLGNDITLTGKPTGSEFTLLGQLNEATVRATFKIENPVGSGSLRLEVGSILINGWFTRGSCVQVNLADVGIEKIGTSNIISSSQLNDISLFRSSAGHDASDDFESCRSMKHYLEPIEKENNVNLIYAPITGTLVSLSGEEGGGFVDDQKTNQRIGIKSSSNSAYEVILYHVDVLDGLDLALGQTITAGQQLGYGRLIRVNSDDPEGSVADASNDFDISVSVGTTSGVANISYFSIASDPVFEEYMAWNSKITSRESLVISKASRDEYPLSCNGEQFTNDNEDLLPRWISDI
tara:strand:+ start:2482 stop:3963 length:1482 start_codon:yes stop_codon:yes gene_type:complete